MLGNTRLFSHSPCNPLSPAQVKYEVLGKFLKHRESWHQMGWSLFINWVVGPWVMLGLAWATLPDEPGYRNGVIIVGIARCAAPHRTHSCARDIGGLATSRTRLWTLGSCWASVCTARGLCTRTADSPDRSRKRPTGRSSVA